MVTRINARALNVITKSIKTIPHKRPLLMENAPTALTEIDNIKSFVAQIPHNLQNSLKVEYLIIALYTPEILKTIYDMTVEHDNQVIT